MDLLNDLAGFYAGNKWIGLFVVPSALTLLAWVLYRRRDELSFHAVQNIAATITIVALNMFVITYFTSDINAFFQAAYDTLGIPTLPHEFWRALPFWLVCVIGVVAKDFVDYWNHRLMHTTWFWPTHAAHHSDTHVNAFTTFRVHAFESLVMGLSYIVPLTWMQMPEAIPLVYMLAHVHNLYVHTRLPYAHGPLKLLIASPVYHRWHHADLKEVHGKNLANVMPLWDWLFGTYYEAGICEAPMGAKSSGIEDKNPFLIYIYPFQRWGQLIRTRLLAPRERSREHGESAAQ